ncbi:MAG: site-specific recombinase [Proteobacteria bacterium]|nr:site-specific recombinase [Pseudomonadota bacterium]
MEARPGNSAQAQLEALLRSADPASLRPERHLWLIALLHWLRAGPQPHLLMPALTTEQLASLPAPVWRAQAVLDALDADAGAHAAVAALLQRFIVHNDATALLADFGFTARPAFWSEFAARLRLKLLPATPDTSDLAALFGLLFPSADDADWLLALPDALLARIAALLTVQRAPNAAAEAAGGEAPTQLAVQDIAAHWRGEIQEAITYSVSQIRAAAFSPDLRRRMRATSEAVEDAVSPFRQLGAAWEALQPQLQAPVDSGLPKAAADGAALPQALTYFRTLLSACALAVRTVPEHLEDNGVSVAIVFDATQLGRRIARVETLLDCLLHANAARGHAQMLGEFVGIARRRRSIRALLARNTSLLARKIAERHAETGEHYITRTPSEYRAMLFAAAGGGLAMGFTTWVKLGLLGLHLPLIPSGFWVGMNYATTFVVVSLLHWTIATKQPAMTAPAMADKLSDLSDRAAVESFVGEVAALIRSQAAGILGNIALVFPIALVLGLAMARATGHPLLSAMHAEREIRSLSLLGPTPLFAMLTGLLLFASSVVAGWAENAFVLNRLDSAIHWNPRIRSTLGSERAARWATWWRSNVSMMAGNVSLGLLMGLLPALLAGFGIVFAVRHVTLAAGMMGASVATLGLGVLREGWFWWSVAGVAATGFLNVVTSFYLAFRLALRSRSIGLQDRRLLNAALRRQLWRRPLSFVWPPTEAP